MPSAGSAEATTKSLTSILIPWVPYAKIPPSLFVIIPGRYRDRGKFHQISRNRIDKINEAFFVLLQVLLIRTTIETQDQVVLQTGQFKMRTLACLFGLCVSAQQILSPQTTPLPPSQDPWYSAPIDFEHT